MQRSPTPTTSEGFLSRQSQRASGIGDNRRKSRLSGAVLVTTIVLSVVGMGSEATSAPRSPGAASPIDLGRKNILSFSTTQTFRVHIPAETSITVSANGRAGDSISISGGGRVAGLVLARDPISGPAAAFVALRFRECSGCRRSARPMLAHFPFRRRIEIYPGDYRLYAIAERPARVVLRLSGLTGSTTLQDGSRGLIDIQSPPAEISSSDDVTVFDAGATYLLEGRYGMAASATWIRGEEYKGSQLAFCFGHRMLNDDAAPPEAATCVQPGPGVSGTFGDDINVLAGRRGRFILYTVIFLDAASVDGYEDGQATGWSYQFSALSPGPAESVGSQALVLTY